MMTMIFPEAIVFVTLMIGLLIGLKENIGPIKLVIFPSGIVTDMFSMIFLFS
ncbi:hypothetical protein EfmJHP36_20640 [Enterococcus faecium]|nr:hypothetical protein EfmJHP36_20640 [Enterococcus faecium]